LKVACPRISSLHIAVESSEGESASGFGPQAPIVSCKGPSRGGGAVAACVLGRVYEPSVSSKYAPQATDNHESLPIYPEGLTKVNERDLSAQNKSGATSTCVSMK
jgi:hypothetical protein